MFLVENYNLGEDVNNELLRGRRDKIADSFRELGLSAACIYIELYEGCNTYLHVHTYTYAERQTRRA